MSVRLAGKVAVVTGSSRGIGRGTAIALAEMGATVYITGRSTGSGPLTIDTTVKMVNDAGGTGIAVQVDHGDDAQIAALFARVKSDFGKLDILVNNAGWTTLVQHGDLDGLTDEIFDKTFKVNVYGTWWLTKAAIPHLRKSDDGNVVNITSIAGVRPVGSSMAYAMTKAALNHMTVLLAKSYGPVRFNAVAPGLVQTPWTKDWGVMHDFVSKASPLKRSAYASDCSEAVLGVIRNPHMTGQVLVIDGGFTLVS